MIARTVLSKAMVAPAWTARARTIRATTAPAETLSARRRSLLKPMMRSGGGLSLCRPPFRASREKIGFEDGEAGVLGIPAITIHADRSRLRMDEVPGIQLAALPHGGCRARLNEQRRITGRSVAHRA